MKWSTNFATTEEDVREKKKKGSHDGAVAEQPGLDKEGRAAAKKGEEGRYGAIDTDDEGRFAGGGRLGEQAWSSPRRNSGRPNCTDREKAGLDQRGRRGPDQEVEEGLRDKAAWLEKKLTELAGVWLAELETVAPFLSLAERQQRFRDNVMGITQAF